MKPSPTDASGRAALKALLESDVRIQRVSSIALGDDSGVLVVTYGDADELPAAMPAEVESLEDAKPAHPKDGCPRCGSNTVLGKVDGDGDLVCARCGNNWHDPSLVDD